MMLVHAIGIGATLLMLAILSWSIRQCPEFRLSPPERSMIAQKGAIWVLTLLINSSALYLGIADWNSMEWSAIIHWATVCFSS